MCSLRSLASGKLVFDLCYFPLQTFQNGRNHWVQIFERPGLSGRIIGLGRTVLSSLMRVPN